MLAFVPSVLPRHQRCRKRKMTNCCLEERLLVGQAPRLLYRDVQVCSLRICSFSENEISFVPIWKEKIWVLVFFLVMGAHFLISA